MVELVRKSIDQRSVEEVAHLIRFRHFDVKEIGSEIGTRIAGSFVNHKISGIQLESLFARLANGDVPPRITRRKRDQQSIYWLIFSFCGRSTNDNYFAFQTTDLLPKVKLNGQIPDLCLLLRYLRTHTVCCGVNLRPIRRQHKIDAKSASPYERMLERQELFTARVFVKLSGGNLILCDEKCAQQEEKEDSCSVKSAGSLIEMPRSGCLELRHLKICSAPS